jgi:glutathione S-transferase
MSIVFYTAPWSSAAPVACALAELGVPHEQVTFNLAAGDQKKPEFLALNPNGQVPTLVVDGTPMFEGLAILIWLGDSHGVERGLWPRVDAPARLEALSWCAWTYVTYGSWLKVLARATGQAAEYHNAVQAALAKKEIGALLGLLEARLSRQKHMLGAEYSLVDLVVASAVGYGTFIGASVDGHPHVKAWLEGTQSRPSFRVLTPS